MLFNSLIFLYLFLPLCLILLFLSPERLKNPLLLMASLLFYAWGGMAFLGVLCCSILLNYAAGILIGNTANHQKARVWFVLGISLNLLLLVIFKYALFLVNNVNLVLDQLGTHSLVIKEIMLPLGISFYTFKGISYLITVKRREAPAQHNVITLSLYLAFFPELIAGPIDRYGYLEPRIRERSTTFAQFSSGVRRFALGLLKKVIISAPLAYVADHVFNNPAETISWPVAWLGAISYTLQIYYDFSGYTDMAIGLGRMMGFELSENFNFPYISRSIGEFWKRWHMTLSTWLRDYLFLPIAYTTSRKLKHERYYGVRVDQLIYVYATLITFLICGFWHGAAWNFVVWGLLHGVMLSLEHTKFGKWLAKTYRPMQHLYVLLFLVLSLVFFRASSLPAAFAFLGVMSGFTGQPVVWMKFFEFFDLEFILIGTIAILGATPFFPAFLGKLEKLTAPANDACLSLKEHGRGIISLLSLLLILLLATMAMISSTNTPFIYFKF